MKKKTEPYPGRTCGNCPPIPKINRQYPMITSEELSVIHKCSPDVIRVRLKRAGIKPLNPETKPRQYPREKAIAAAAPVILTIPPHLAPISELAEIAERTKGCIAYRLRKAGINPVAVIHRRGSIPGTQGGRPMLLYPRREALLAVLDK